MSAAPRARVQRRPVHGVLLLDKPLGLTSNQALQKAKWLLRAEKAGHTGTLDPLASGVLPLCFGAATKFSALHLDADKSYEGKAHEKALADLKEKHDNDALDISNEIAKLMSVKLVADTYSSMKIKVTEKNAQKFENDINKTAKELLERKDFQKMMSDNPQKKIYDFAVNDNGKMLLPMLSKASKAIIKEDTITNKAKLEKQKALEQPVKKTEGLKK